VGRDDEPDLHSKKRRKRRENEEQEETQAEDQAESADSALAESDVRESEETAPEQPDLETIQREIAAETAFRERVALTEIMNRLSPEGRTIVEHALAATSLEWRLEKGRHLFRALVGERTVPTDSGPARVEQVVALDRDEPPAPPEQVDALLTNVLSEKRQPAEIIQRLEPLKAVMPEGDEIRIAIPKAPEIVVTAEAVEAAPEEEPPARELEEPETEPNRPAVEKIVAEIQREPEVEVDPEPKESRQQPKPDAELPADQDVVPETPVSQVDLPQVLEVLEREAVDLNELPPIRGGAPEADGLSPEEITELEELLENVEPLEDPELQPEVETESPVEGVIVPQVPEPSEPKRRRPKSRKGRQILAWNPEIGVVERTPDYRMKKKARKLVRRLAAEYGIKLTPQIEAYLLAIVLRPHLIDGRRVYSLGLNIDKLVAVLGVLKYNFNQTRRPPAQG
jgi:pilus assembly protein FimV